jgi:hypothetical protein
VPRATASRTGPSSSAKPHSPAPLCRRQSSASLDRSADARRRSRPRSQRDDQTPTAAANRPARMVTVLTAARIGERLAGGCTCYHPLFVFNQFGDLERCALRFSGFRCSRIWRCHNLSAEDLHSGYSGLLVRFWYQSAVFHVIAEGALAAAVDALCGNRSLRLRLHNKQIFLF